MFGNPERRRDRRPGENLIRQEDVFVHHAFERRKVQSNQQMKYTKNDASMSSYFPTLEGAKGKPEPHGDHCVFAQLRKYDKRQRRLEIPIV